MNAENEILEINELDVSTGDAASALAYEVTDSADISPGSTGDFLSDISFAFPVDVSGGDVQTVPQSQTPVLSPEVGYMLADPIDYTDTLTHIDEVLGHIDQSLTLIVFLILFIWCSHHVRNAVRYITGRGID